MDKYEAVRDQIRQARIERSVYLADLLSDIVVDGWKAIRSVTDRAIGHARAKPATRTNVFTFDV
ncbi:MAG: hypothetical protein IPJ28_06615 [Betaproteobacteria bacterium]|nr:hypothetical protein [Betaproteobacteria bacterium]